MKRARSVHGERSRRGRRRLRGTVVASLLLVGGCGAPPPPPVRPAPEPAPVEPPTPETPAVEPGIAATPPAPLSTVGLDSAGWLRLHALHKVTSLDRRRFTHAQLWRALDAVLAGAPQIVRREAGRSAEGRPLFTLRYGEGPTAVLLWSQMHGDESTGTMALADVVHFLATDPGHPLARLIHERLSVVLLPMLNPDGAERFQRRNALGIDVNRDARRRTTPEARALKATQEGFRPDFAFNLHDQSPRTRVGDGGEGAAVALLAPAKDSAGTVDEGRLRALRLAAHLRAALEPWVPGRITRYDDAFNPRAFGDLMQQWGASTVLVEAGGWPGDPQKQHLRLAHFVGLLSGLEALATGAWEEADTAWYGALPPNGRRVHDLLIAGGTVIAPGLPPFRADVSVDYAEAGVPRGGRIVDIGDLEGVAEAVDTLDASGLFLHADSTALRRDSLGVMVAPGQPASFDVREGPERASVAVWFVREGRVERPRRQEPEPRRRDDGAGERD